MKRFNLLVVVCASVLISSGCNGPTQTASEPAPQKITEATPTSAAINEPANEPTAVPIKQATPGANNKLAASEIAPKKSKRVAAFDMKKFHVARTLELPYYDDSISGFAFAPDGKTVAGAGRGAAIGDVNVAERGVVFLFDATDGKLLRRLAAPPLSESHLAYFDRALWSPDGKLVAAWNPDHAPENKVALCVWDRASGRRTAFFSDEKWSVSAAAWARDGTLLVARSNNAAPLTAQGQLMICDGRTGEIHSLFDLEDRVVTWIGVPQQGPPHLLVSKQIAGDGATQSPLFQSSVRQWLGNAWSQPLLQLNPNEIFLGAAFGPDDLLALTGVEQSGNTRNWGDSIHALFLMAHLKTGEIVWQKTRNPMDICIEMALSPDEKQIFARVMTIRPKLVFEVSDGAVSSLPNRNYPIFAPDGKRFLRQLDRVTGSDLTSLPSGKKPNLKIAQIYER